MTGTPMVIHLYDPETGDVEITYSQNFVPWRLLKVAVALAGQIDSSNMTPEDVDRLGSLVVEAFGNRFSLDDLSAKGDITEVTAVLTQIVNKARGVAPVPPPGPG